MTPRDFVYWLQGYVEVAEKNPTPEQWEKIKEHLQLVFTKITSGGARHGVEEVDIVEAALDKISADPKVDLNELIKKFDNSHPDGKKLCTNSRIRGARLTPGLVC